MKKKLIGLIPIGLMLVLSISGCVEEESVELQDVTVKLKWLHCVQFAGLYIANEKGYYADENLNVTIEETDFTNEPVDVIAEGNAEFGVDDADRILVKMGEGASLKTIGVIFRIGPLGYVSLKDSNITIPTDFVGKNIGLTPDAHAMHSAVVKKLGMDPGSMTVINGSYNYTPLITGEYDVFTVYVTDETYHITEEEGHELNVILPSDYGVSFYADSIFTSDEIIENDPELVEKFLRATLKGWQYALENKEEALDVTEKYEVGRYANREYEEYIYDHQFPLIHTGESNVGWMSSERWQEMYDILNDYGEIETGFDVSQAYTMQFLESIYS
ncbi:MAG: ABC transporter substrate-binding protein [Candidatus Thermoplasmatota archaeon]|nr:ABC transporter substrate-binding protein [Candidatus Thermoplasmatota archaeon]